MKRRLFWYTTLILFTGLLAYFSVSVYITYNNNLTLAKDTVIETTQIFAGMYNGEEDLQSFVQAGDYTRVTVIAPGGTVLADSDPLDLQALENHIDRPEVQAALNGAPETFVRYSSTLGADLIYYAKLVHTNSEDVIIRVGVPVARTDAYLLRALPLLILLFAAIAVLCFLFASRIINRITKPFETVETRLRALASGEYPKEEPMPESYEEIDKITREISEVSGILQKSLHALQDEKDKLDYIVNNIGDGLFVLNEQSEIVLVNAAALSIFGAKLGVASKNLNYLSYNKMLATAATECVNNGKSSIFELPMDGHVYFTAVKRLPQTALTMVVLSDVTENRESAKQREEFFANASHELKTPLAAIRGFNELAEINNKDEQIEKYLAGISKETDRMMLLIGDMLKLSQIENTGELSPVPVSLEKIASEVCETLSAVIEDKRINLEISGDATVNAEPSHAYELIKNLVENAVRYNIIGGNVTVDISATHMTISDNGIGIPLDEQPRIFERFYRVEKSRSQSGGGTGLGLSIAKHICVLYGWELTLQSKLGVGTDVTITFAI